MVCTRLTVPIVAKQIFDAVDVILVVALEMFEKVIVDDVLLLEG